MIRTVDPRTDPAWRELMLSPRGSLFGAPPWLSAICDTYGFDMSANLTLDGGGQVTGGFAFAEVDDFLGPRLLSLPFCDFLDPVVDTDDDWHAVVDPVVARNLPYQIRVINADEPRRDERFVQVDEMAWHGTDLLADEDAILRGWSRQARQNVRTAEQERRDHSLRLRPRGRARVPRAPPPHAEAQALAARAAGRVLREHLEAVRPRRRHRVRASPSTRAT